MKKLRFFTILCLLALVMGTLAGCKKEENGTNNGGSGNGSSGDAEFVDLGLPSGTKWKSSNEMGNGSGFYTYDEAISTFGSQLPTREQFEELHACCTWEWQGDGGYKLTSTNGNSIVLPAAGYRTCNGNVVDQVASYGYYWSFTSDNSESAWFLFFGSDMWYTTYNGRCSGFSVRLVQN